MRTFKSAKKSAFTNKSAQKSTLKSTFGSSEPIWFKIILLVCNPFKIKLKYAALGAEFLLTSDLNLDLILKAVLKLSLIHI